MLYVVSKKVGTSCNRTGNLKGSLPPRLNNLHIWTTLITSISLQIRPLYIILFITAHFFELWNQWEMHPVHFSPNGTNSRKTEALNTFAITIALFVTTMDEQKNEFSEQTALWWTFPRLGIRILSAECPFHLILPVNYIWWETKIKPLITYELTHDPIAWFMSSTMCFFCEVPL